MPKPAMIEPNGRVKVASLEDTARAAAAFESAAAFFEDLRCYSKRLQAARFQMPEFTRN